MKREIASMVGGVLTLFILGVLLGILFQKSEAIRRPELLLLSDYDTGQGTIYVRFMDGLEYHDIPITGGREEVEAVKRHIQEVIR